MKQTQARRRRAFTLIEVLVVVAIIALLVAMLFPSLANARALARTTTCKTSLHQLGIGMHTYRHVYSTFPAHQFKSGGKRIRWFLAMAGELHGYSVSSCPDVPDWEIGRNNAYGYNYKYLGSGRENLVSPTAPYERHPVRSLPAPSSTIAFGDADGTGWTKPHVNESILLEETGSNNDYEMFGNHGYTLDPTYIPEFCLHTSGESYASKNWRSYISTRHQGGSNIVFADGHADLLLPRDVYRNNRYWNGLGGVDHRRDVHVSYRHVEGEWRFPDVKADPLPKD